MSEIVQTLAAEESEPYIAPRLAGVRSWANDVANRRSFEAGMKRSFKPILAAIILLSFAVPVAACPFGGCWCCA
jgi:hypothetical protein